MVFVVIGTVMLGLTGPIGAKAQTPSEDRTTDRPNASRTEAAPQTPTREGFVRTLLSTIPKLLFGKSFDAYLNALCLGEEASESALNACRWEAGTGLTVELGTPAGSRFVVLSPAGRTAFFLQNGELFRQALNNDNVVEGNPVPVSLIPDRDVTMLIGVVAGAPGKLIGLTGQQEPIEIDTEIGSTRIIEVEVTKEDIHILATQSVAANGALAIAEIPRSNVAQITLLPDGKASTHSKLVVRLQGSISSPVSVVDPRWSDDGAYLTYSVGCGSPPCCPR
jgi:hypothetical protein